MTNAATVRLLKAGAAMGLFVSLSYGQGSASKPKAPILSLALELRSDPGQADLKAFLSHQKALETMPKSASQGDQAVVWTNNAIRAVSKAAPFDGVPDSADVPVVLRLTFYYNVAPPSVQ